MLVELEKPTWAERDEDSRKSDLSSENKRRKLKRYKTRQVIRFCETKVSVPRKPVPIHESETIRCVALWRSVILQALYDLSGKGGSLERKLTRARSFSWFYEMNGGDFEQVCELAEYDVKMVLKAVRIIREEEIDIESMNLSTIEKEFSMRRSS